MKIGRPTNEERTGGCRLSREELAHLAWLIELELGGESVTDQAAVTALRVTPPGLSQPLV